MWFEDGDYYGRGVELPGTMDDGRMPDECMSKTRDAFVTTVAYMLEAGETPPPPAVDGARSENIPVSVSALELLALRSAAEQQGYRDVGSYVRAAALGAPSGKTARRSPRRRSIAR